MPCPGCGGSAGTRRLAVTETMFGTGEVFDVEECTACGSVRLADPPADLAPYYPEAYYSLDVDPERALGRPPARWLAAATARSVLHGRGRLARAARRVVPVRQYATLVSLLESVALAGLPGGRATRVLDVGCGSGALVYALGLAGLTDVTGVDPFVPGDRTLDTGGRVLRRDLAEVTGAWDLVMLHHSLEHVPDPEATLTRARGLLAPQGRILVRMPTTSSAAYHRYGAHWVQLDVPRHLTVLSRAGVAALAARAGLEVVATRDDSTAFQFWGSEQAAAGVPLTAAGSHMTHPGDSPFTRAQVRRWQAEADRLNARGEGDQAAWVLRPAAG